jgi:hypothetical protein
MSLGQGLGGREGDGMDVDGDGDGMRWEKESPAKKESAGSDVGGGKSSRSTSRSRQTAAKEEVCTVLVVPGSGPGCLRSKKHPWDPKLGNNWNCRCAQKSPTPVTAAGQVHSVCYWAIPWTGAVKLKPFTRAKEALKNSQDKKATTPGKNVTGGTGTHQHQMSSQGTISEKVGESRAI